MRRYVWAALVAIVLVAVVPGSASGRTYEIDYATYDVFVTDSKGVRTEAWDFGFYGGLEHWSTRTYSSNFRGFAVRSGR